VLIDNEAITLINLGFQKQVTGLIDDFAKVTANRELSSSLDCRTTGQMFAQRLTVHNSVYNPLLAEGLRNRNIIQNRNARHSMFKVIVTGYVFALITQRGHTRGRCEP